MKKYYWISELKELFDLSMLDLEYLNAETNISFCLYCKTANVILGGWKDGKFNEAGIASYSGLISLTKEQQTELFEKRKRIYQDSHKHGVCTSKMASLSIFLQSGKEIKKKK